MKTTSIKRNREFQRAYKRGKSRVNHSFVLYYCPNRLQENRVGFTVSKKIGNAVNRNRVRRRLKEAFRLCEPLNVQGFDLVIVARQRAKTVDFQDLQEQMQKEIRQIKRS